MYDPSTGLLLGFLSLISIQYMLFRIKTVLREKYCRDESKLVYRWQTSPGYISSKLTYFSHLFRSVLETPTVLSCYPAKLKTFLTFSELGSASGKNGENTIWQNESYVLPTVYAGIFYFFVILEPDYKKRDSESALWTAQQKALFFTILGLFFYCLISSPPLFLFNSAFSYTIRVSPVRSSPGIVFLEMRGRNMWRETQTLQSSFGRGE